MRSLTLVTHCWRYSRCLTYQLASLLEHGREVAPVVHVYCCREDAPTVRVVEEFVERSQDCEVAIHAEYRPLEVVQRREIGRNEVALNSTTDLVWFTDCDYYFGAKCLDILCTLPLPESKLYYPERIWATKNKPIGDDYSRAAADWPKTPLREITVDDFSVTRPGKAIGGIQIIPGTVARAVGYCKDDAGLQTPSPGGWRPMRGDVVIRRVLGTRGTPIPLPNLYRIRQSRSGAVDTL
jgi:hypothetical protein